MITIDFIRHGKTKGNEEKRYIGGRTDESLSETGVYHLKQVYYEKPEILFVSPMKRCIETAEILFPGQKQQKVEELRECDFGIFENKNFKELDGNADYQAWIDSNGEMPFPGGESREAFRERNRLGFDCAVKEIISLGKSSAAFVVHGGTIMNIMEIYGIPKRNFYDYHVENGCGFRAGLEEKRWINGAKELVQICVLPLAQECKR